MQVETLEGLTAGDLDMLIEYVELLSAIVSSLPGGDEALGRALLEKPDLFLKIAHFVLSS